MISSSKSFIAIVVSAAALTVAAGAVAQDRTPAARPPAGPDRFAERLHERQAQRARMMHEALNIRPDQEPAFQAFQAALPPAPRDGRRERPDAKAAAPMTTPERLDRRLARLDQMQKRFQTRAVAIKAFYAALTPDQRHTFDALPMMQGGMMGRHGMHGRFGGGPRA